MKLTPVVALLMTAMLLCACGRKAAPPDSAAVAAHSFPAGLRPGLTREEVASRIKASTPRNVESHTVSDSEILFYPIDFGNEAGALTATFFKGKLSRVSVRVDVTGPRAAAISENLHANYGHPIRIGGDDLRWLVNSTPPSAVFFLPSDGYVTLSYADLGEVGMSEIDALEAEKKSKAAKSGP